MAETIFRITQNQRLCSTLCTCRLQEKNRHETILFLPHAPLHDNVITEAKLLHHTVKTLITQHHIHMTSLACPPLAGPHLFPQGSHPSSPIGGSQPWPSSTFTSMNETWRSKTPWKLKKTPRPSHRRIATLAFLTDSTQLSQRRKNYKSVASPNPSIPFAGPAKGRNSTDIVTLDNRHHNQWSWGFHGIRIESYRMTRQTIYSWKAREDAKIIYIIFRIDSCLFRESVAGRWTNQIACNMLSSLKDHLQKKSGQAFYASSSISYYY